MRLYIIVDGQRLDLAQVTTGTMYFDQPTMLPMGRAELVLSVDDNIRRWDVHIPAQTAPSRQVAFVTC